MCCKIRINFKTCKADFFSKGNFDDVKFILTLQKKFILVDRHIFSKSIRKIYMALRRALAGKKRIIIEDLVKEVDPYFTCILAFLRYANLKATIIRDRGDKKQHDDVTLPKWRHRQVAELQSSGRQRERRSNRRDYMHTKEYLIVEYFHGFC